MNPVNPTFADNLTFVLAQALDLQISAPDETIASLVAGQLALAAEALGKIEGNERGPDSVRLFHDEITRGISQDDVPEPVHRAYLKMTDAGMTDPALINAYFDAVARQLFEGVIELKSWNDETKEGIRVVFLAEDGMVEGALELVKEIKNPKIRAATLAAMTLPCVKAGQSEEIRALLGELITRMDTRCLLPEVMFDLAEAFATLGEAARAVELAQHAARSHYPTWRINGVVERIAVSLAKAGFTEMAYEAAEILSREWQRQNLRKKVIESIPPQAATKS